MGAISRNEDSRPQRRDKDAQTKDDQLIDVMERAGAGWDCEHPKSRPAASKKPHSTENHLFLSTGVHNIAEKVMQEAMN